MGVEPKDTSVVAILDSLARRQRGVRAAGELWMQGGLQGQLQMQQGRTAMQQSLQVSGRVHEQ